jgi:hypothetical protein
MPARFCKNCIWGLRTKGFGKEGIECRNPNLGNVQRDNVMPSSAKACHLYQPLIKKRKK